MENFAAIGGWIHEKVTIELPSCYSFREPLKKTKNESDVEKNNIRNFETVNTHLCLDFDVAYIRIRPIEISIHSSFNS